MYFISIPDAVIIEANFAEFFFGKKMGKNWWVGPQKMEKKDTDSLKLTAKAPENRPFAPKGN